MERELSFVSWNTRGIKDTVKAPNKLTDVLGVLDKLQADVFYIQETHVGPDNYNALEIVEGWTTYFTVFSSQSKGVAILIREGVPFEYICHDEDHSGGYIVLFCHLYGELYTLVNVYNHKNDKQVLKSLSQYLQETAEGVLVVGGDFNTALDPDLDRRPSRTSDPLRKGLKDFTSDLHLRDIWAHLHPTDRGFTRNEPNRSSSSRLDMFFMPENAMGRVVECEINPRHISDHDPVLLTLKVHQTLIKQIPRVASMLEKYNRIPDRSSWKINGAEILSTIKSLINSGEERPDGLTVNFYKNNCCPLTEVLKVKYNRILKSQKLPLMFCENIYLENRSIFTAEYLIFAQILAKRLTILIPSFKQNMTVRVNNHIVLTFADIPKKIKWSFIEQSLLGLKDSHLAPDFQVLKSLLSEDCEQFVCLQQECPLTWPLLTLVLKQLEQELFKIGCKTRFNQDRQTLVINLDIDRLQLIRIMKEEFMEKSGIRLREIYLD